ncbi:MAG: hypothetical protein IKG52_09715 [Rhodobacteraceae bacterium]|nr:hypothetical protein [Paracoccaceae bacterium]
MLSFKMKTVAAIFFSTLTAAAPSFAQEAEPEVLSIEVLGRIVVASRNCGQGTAFPPEIAGAYIQRFANQEGISFEKAKYMAISKGNDTLARLISSGTKDNFCLSVIR